MLISAILVALIAIGSQWWFSHTITRTWLYPIWAGFMVAVVMGDPINGMKAAAYIQLTYLGWITAGGTMPGNLMVAGVFGTALTIISGASPSLAPTFAVPFSLLGILINQAYMTINAFWVHKADKYLEQGNITGVRLMNYVPSGITSTILYGVPAFCLVRRRFCNKSTCSNSTEYHRCIKRCRCINASIRNRNVIKFSC